MARQVWMVAVAWAALAATAVRAEGPPEPPKPQPGGPEAGWQMGANPGVGEYWLGLQLAPPSEALRAQLGLHDAEGLVVEDLVPDSPAAKAGIQRYDVLTKANGKTLKTTSDLLEEIAKVKEGKLSLDLVRGGKHQTMATTPEKRPAGGKALFFSPPRERDSETIREWMKEMLPQAGEGGPMRFQFFHPGQIVPPGALPPPGANVTFKATVKMEANLPDGSKVEIVREGHNPAQVTVTREKEKWEATEGDLSKLPEKIRPEVEKLLHSGPGSGPMWIGSSAPEARHFEIRTAPFGEAGPLGEPRRIEKRLDDLNRQLEQLRKSVDELRGKVGPEKK